MMNAHRAPVPDTYLLAVVAGLGIAIVATALGGIWRFRAPRRIDALDRIDAGFETRPIATLTDTQAIGSNDPASQSIWQAHQRRMAETLHSARAVRPAPNLHLYDRFGLRIMAATVFVIALIFGAFGRIADVPGALNNTGAEALAGGPVWEGWADPPGYTGLPSLYLADIDAPTLELPKGTEIIIRLYGEVGALRVIEDISTTPHANPETPNQEFTVLSDGKLSIEGPGGRDWHIDLIPDAPPQIDPNGPVEWALGGHLRQSFSAMDDYGIDTARAVISLDIDKVDRRFGLSIRPEKRAPLEIDLPLPITGNRDAFTETFTEDLSKHPWALLPVSIQLIATDALEQGASSSPVFTPLPARRFFDPMAKAVIETRRDLLWSRENGPRSAQILRAITHRPDDLDQSASAYLQLRTAIRRLESHLATDTFDGAKRDELADVLWDIALLIELGNLADAQARLERAQDKLSEAIENGATDAEIAGLIDELRQAMEDVMRQMAEQQSPQDQNQQAENQQMQQLTQQDIQDMLDRLQQLMEEGRMDEAQQLMDQMREMMENMQVTQGQDGQNQSPGQQAMEGLSETLREQQGLSDDAFRDLQEQFNPDANQGQSQGNSGRNGGLGEGAEHQGGQGSGESQQGEGGQQNQGDAGQSNGQNGGEGGDENLGQSLADRQRGLRQELGRQQGSLPGAGTPEGDAAREALDRAGRAMDRAENDLRSDDLPGAIDNQAQAIDALREGMQSLAESMNQQQPGQGEQTGQANPNGRRDPLGREEGNQGQVGTEENLLQGDDVYRRARELLDEIRKRQGDRTRPAAEIDYLKRLLDRF